MATGDSSREAYTAIAWGVGLSHERSDIAGAEGFHSLEGNMCGTARRGADALPRSKATSRAKGSHRNLGDLVSGRRRRVLCVYGGPHWEGEEPKPMMHGPEAGPRHSSIEAGEPPLGSRPIAETASGRNLATSSAQPAGRYSPKRTSPQAAPPRPGGPSTRQCRHRKAFHLRIPSLLMRARAQATVRVWKNRLEHQAHSRSNFRGGCGLPVVTEGGL